MPVSNQDLARFQNLFRGRENLHGQTTVDEQGAKKSSWTEHRGPSLREWEQHLKGTGPGLGIGASMQSNQCYFAAIDYDDGEMSNETLAGLIGHSQLPLVLCRTKSGDSHLYVFFIDPVPSKLVIEKLREWAAHFGIEKRGIKAGKLAGQPIEIFPKSSRLAPSEEGSWINLPYYNADRTTRYCVTDTGDRLSLQDFLDYAESRKVSSTEFAALKPFSAFRGGPPCLRTLDTLGYPDGTRNQGLYNIAIYYKMAQPDNWKSLTAEYNEQNMEPPLRDGEVKALLKSIDGKDYVYKCEELPIQPHCKKQECKKEEFGISAFTRLRQRQAMPELANLRKLTTDPPMWLLEVGGVDVALATDDLMNIPRFRRVVMNKISRIFPLMKQGDWDDVLNELLKNHTVLEAAEDAGVLGQFKVLVADFLTRRVNAQTIEDVMHGLPFQKEQKILFRSSDLLSFLERKKFREYQANEVYEALRQIGCEHTKEHIMGSQQRLWSLPVPLVGEEQTEEFSQKVDDNPRM